MSKTNLTISKQRQKAQKAIEVAHKLAEKVSAQSLEQYLQYVVIDSKPEPRKFSDVADPWQWELNKKVIPAFENIARISKGGYSGPTCFWFTLPKGHDKSSFLGRLLNGILAFSPAALNCIACASDLDQAKLIIQFMKAEADLNRWLGRHLDFSQKTVYGLNNGSKLEAQSADAPSSSGLKFDICVVDEITEWTKRDLWDKIYPGRRKTLGCVVLVITNAGTMFEWQHDLLLAAKGRPDLWYVYEAPGQIASWMSQEKLEEEKAFIPEPEYVRKYMNIWVDPSVTYGFVPRSALELCWQNSLAKGLVYKTEGDPKEYYVASIDYGPVKDRTVLCVTHQDRETGSVIVDRMEVWQGSRTNRVKIEAVERWIDEVRSKFRISCLVIDPYQMESTIQRYEGRMPIYRHESRAGKANYQMAQVLRGLIVEGKLLWYPGCGDIPFRGKNHTLLDEFNELIVTKCGYGYRIDHLPDRHDDRVVAIGQAALKLLEDRPRKPLYNSDYFW